MSSSAAIRNITTPSLQHLARVALDRRVDPWTTERLALRDGALKADPCVLADFLCLDLGEGRHEK
jgi:hypothetical protein